MICICKEGGEEKLKNLKNILNYIVLITVLFTGVMGKTQCAEAKIYDGDKLKIVTLTGKVVKYVGKKVTVKGEFMGAASGYYCERYAIMASSIKKYKKK